MRPQRNAAENVRAQTLADQGLQASMRPQRNAAENVTLRLMASAIRAGFNEAAA